MRRFFFVEVALVEAAGAFFFFGAVAVLDVVLASAALLWGMKAAPRMRERVKSKANPVLTQICLGLNRICFAADLSTIAGVSVALVMSAVFVLIVGVIHMPHATPSRKITTGKKLICCKDLIRCGGMATFW
ncbi:MAG: hypothetical protein ACM3TT_13100 [Syntrophothermus sp.]